MVRVKLPYHLQNLARSGAEVEVNLDGAVTIRAIVDALEAQYPALRGTIRDHGTGERRAFLRYFACQEDLSFAPVDEELPAAVAEGSEPFMIVGAIAGG
jgi:molybdopterin synthase sulfur carrier subunit